ncbi:MAG: ATP-binding protein [Candidatus Woesearchaeota archaeon]|nr:ATP-binding protein [Candidatus Woesearchaeota archaeon]
MSELQQAVEDFGKECLALPDLLDDRFPFEDSVPEDIQNEVRRLNYEQIESLMGSGGNVEDMLEKQGVSDHSSFAARMWGHDTSYVFHTTRTIISVMKTEHVEDVARVTELLPYMENIRIFGGTMAYLSSGCEDYLVDIAPAHVKPCTHAAFDGRLDVQTQVTRNITSAGYVAFCQLVKNAKGPYPYEHHGVRAHIEQDDTVTRFVVKDNGPGFHDREENPATAGNLAHFVGGYSRKPKGGLGLQVAKALAHLRGGWLEIETTPKSSPMLHYDSRKEDVAEHHGVKASISIPHRLPHSL